MPVSHLYVWTDNNGEQHDVIHHIPLALRMLYKGCYRISILLAFSLERAKTIQMRYVRTPLFFWTEKKVTVLKNIRIWVDGAELFNNFRYCLVRFCAVIQRTVFLELISCMYIKATTKIVRNQITWSLIRNNCLRYPSILERILGIHPVFAQRQSIRQVSFEFMTRELLWHGFAVSVFLLFI